MNPITVLKKVSILILTLLILYSPSTPPTHAQEDSPFGQDIRFTHLSLEDGLSQTTVKSILQDSRGFMWFGTQDGLNRYDGYNFVVYRNDPSDLNSLSGNNINAISEDTAGALWIGTSTGGVNKFDPVTETFTRYRHNPQNPNSLSTNNVFTLYHDQAGILWMGTTEGWLNKFDPESETFTRYQSNPDKPSTIHAIFQDKIGDLWLGAGNGLYQFNPETEQFTYFQHDPDDATTGPVLTIYEDRAGNLWVGSDNGGGLHLLDRNSGQFTRFRHDPDDPHSISDDSIYSIYQDSSGALWIATLRGLNRFDPETGQFTRYRKDVTNPFSLSKDYIRTIYEDHGGVLWFGTHGGGINKFDPRSVQFIHYRNLPNNPNSLSTSFIHTIYEDDEGTLWIGGDDGVLNRFDRANEQVTHYKPDADDPDALNPSLTISVLYEDSDDTFWVGTHTGGLHSFDRQTEQFQRYRHNPSNPNSLPSDVIVTIYEDSSGTLWVGLGEGGGLSRFDRRTGQFYTYRPDPNDPQSLSNTISDIYEDQFGTFWLTGLVGGLTRFDPQTEQFYSYRHDPNNTRSISSDRTFAIHEDRSGNLWVGTSRGLNRFDRETEAFTHYTEKDGLPNNVIYAILEDASGNLWVSTNKGVSKFDPHAEAFQNYNVDDGLQSDEFNQNAFFQSKNGEIFFAGINGLNAFYPENIINNPYLPPVILTDFQLFNQSVAIGEEAILQKPIWDTEQIILNYDQDVFTIEFAGLSYAAPEENRYRYKLEGFDADWNEVDAKRRFAIYTNLPPGSYTFRVIAGNEDGVWSEEGASLNITVTPPWWQTWWFRGLAVLAAVSLIAGTFVGQRQSAKRRERQLATQVAERTHELAEANTQLERAKSQAETARDDAEAARKVAEIANQAKSEFLASMSHELRTPLNSILGFAEILQHQSADREVRKRLGMIHQSGEHLLTLINDILDLSRIEAGKLELHPQHIHLSSFLETIAHIIRERAEAKDLLLVYEGDETLPAGVMADETRLRQVLLNLLGNAVKFTDAGQVTLRAAVSHQPVAESQETNGYQQAAIRFEVEDTGVGISPDQLETIFQPFEQVGEVARGREGTGLGLPISWQLVQLMGGDIQVESTPGQGSRFWFEVTLPLTEGAVPVEETQFQVISGYEGPKLTVLVVDDVELNRALLVDMLAPLGFDTLEAEDGQQALELARTHQPDLILMDRRMPVMDGLEAIWQLRQIPRLAKTPVISISASVSERDRAEIMAAGYNAFLPKPVSWSALTAQLEAHLPLEWTYEAVEVEAEMSEAEIVLPPRADLEALYELARYGSIARIQDWVQALAERDEKYQPLAVKLGHLAENYEIERITQLAQQYLKETET